MTTISTLPPAPSRSDPASFATRADALLSALPTLVSETNTVAGEINAAMSAAAGSASAASTSAGNAAASATSANNSASAAASVAGASQWVSGTYAQGDCAWSPTDYQTYRCTVAGSRTIDPASDAANWTKISGSSSFVFHAREEQASGTGGGTSLNPGTQVRTLNTVKTNTISGASLASNLITIPAGTYDVLARVPRFCQSGQASLYNNTDSTTLLVGASSYSNSAGHVDSLIQGRITLSAQKVVKINHYTSGTTTTDGLGKAITSGLGEVYSEIWITKVN